MTISQINSKKQEFNFVTAFGENVTVHSCNGLLGAKKNFNKRFASNSIEEIETYLGNKKFITIVPNTKGYMVTYNQTLAGKRRTLNETQKLIMSYMD